MKQVKVCLGRFQPFTLGHLKMATYKDLKGPDKEQQDKLREQPDLKEIAKQKTIILSILTTKDKVDTRHPFGADLMKDELELLRKNYSSDIEDIMYVKSADICAWGEMLKQKGYQASVWLTGSDEFDMYKGMALKVPEYEEHNRNNYDCKDAYTKSFYVENIERTDDGDFVSSISGTKVRQALLNSDKELFAKMMPKGADKYFDKFKEAIENAPEPKKKTKSIKSKIKESLNMKSILEYINESKSLSFLNYDEITDKMVEDFWNKADYKENLVQIDKIDKDFKNAYEIAKKNVASLEYPMHSGYTVYFDKDGNLLININHGASWSAQNHLSHYADKMGKFKLRTSAWTNVNYFNEKNKIWELLYDGSKNK